MARKHICQLVAVFIAGVGLMCEEGNNTPDDGVANDLGHPCTVDGDANGCIDDGGTAEGGVESDVAYEYLGVEPFYHQVTLTYDFKIKATEVTVREYEQAMGYNPIEKYCPNKEYSAYCYVTREVYMACGEECPVAGIPWHEALSYCNILSKNAGLEECFDCTGSYELTKCQLKAAYQVPQECPGYRLPTEAEWEYAARAGTTTDFYSGDLEEPSNITFDVGPETDVDRIAWYINTSKDVPHAVRLKQANQWGLYDMSGNVGEWVLDYMHDQIALYETPDHAWVVYDNPMTDPLGRMTGPEHHCRGGWFRESADRCTSYWRGVCLEQIADDMGVTVENWAIVGLRPVRSMGQREVADPEGCVHPEVVEDCTDDWCQIPSGCFMMGDRHKICREAPWCTDYFKCLPEGECNEHPSE